MKKRIRTLTMGSILVLHLSSCQESLDYNFYDLKKIEPPVIKTLSSNENDIDEKLNTIISTILDIIPSMYNDNTRFIEDIGADELKMQAFFNKVEETFNIKLFDSEKDNCKTVGNLKALLKKLCYPKAQQYYSNYGPVIFQTENDIIPNFDLSFNLNCTTKCMNQRSNIISEVTNIDATVTPFNFSSDQDWIITITYKSEKGNYIAKTLNTEITWKGTVTSTIAYTNGNKIIEKWEVIIHAIVSNERGLVLTTSNIEKKGKEIKPNKESDNNKDDLSHYTFEFLKKIISEQCNIDPAFIHKESQLIHELNLDSLDFIELIMRIEEEYGIDISAENAERLNTAGDLYQYIIEHA